MRHASPIARLTLAATLLCAAGAAAQPRVRVRAESRIELRTERPDAPGSVLLQGVLRDDLGAPLPGREVELQVRAAWLAKLLLGHLLDAGGEEGSALGGGLHR